MQVAELICHQISDQQAEFDQLDKPTLIPTGSFFAFHAGFPLHNLISQLWHGLLRFLDVTVSICT